MAKPPENRGRRKCLTPHWQGQSLNVTLHWVERGWSGQGVMAGRQTGSWGGASPVGLSPAQSESLPPSPHRIGNGSRPAKDRGHMLSNLPWGGRELLRHVP